MVIKLILGTTVNLPCLNS